MLEPKLNQGGRIIKLPAFKQNDGIAGTANTLLQGKTEIISTVHTPLVSSLTVSS